MENIIKAHSTHNQNIESCLSLFAIQLQVIQQGEIYQILYKRAVSNTVAEHFE